METVLCEAVFAVRGQASVSSNLGTTELGGVSGGRLPDLQPPAGNPARGIALGVLAALPLWGVIVFVGRLVARGV